MTYIVASISIEKYPEVHEDKVLALFPHTRRDFDRKTWALSSFRSSPPLPSLFSPFLERDTRITNDFFLQTALRSVSVRRYVSVEAEFPARGATSSSLSPLFSEQSSDKFYLCARYNAHLRVARSLSRPIVQFVRAFEVLRYISRIRLYRMRQQNVPKRCLSRCVLMTFLQDDLRFLYNYHIQNTKYVFESNLFSYFRFQFSIYNLL